MVKSVISKYIVGLKNSKNPFTQLVYNFKIIYYITPIVCHLILNILNWLLFGFKYVKLVIKLVNCVSFDFKYVKLVIKLVNCMSITRNSLNKTYLNLCLGTFS